MATEAEQRKRAMSQVHGTIDRARAVWRLVEALDGLLKTFIVGGGGLVAGMLLDNLFHLPAAVRLGYAVLLALAALVTAGRYLVYPALRPLTDEMVAAHLERGLPELDNRLINAVLLYHERFRDTLARRMALSQITETARWVAGRALPRPPDVRRLWRPARWAIVLVGVAGLYALLFTSHFGNAFARIVRPSADVPPLTNTRLDVRPGDASVLQGDSLRVEAGVRGVLPESAEIRVRTEDGGSSAAMMFAGSAFTHTFANVQGGFSYRVSAGDALTRWYDVRVGRRPQVTSVEFGYEYPAYTGMAPEEATGGDIRAVVGTRVVLRVATDVPVRSGHIEFTPEDGSAETKSVPLTLAAPMGLRGDMTLERSGRYAIRVTDENGVENMPRLRRVEAVPDAAPRVTFVKPGRDMAVAPDGRVTLLAAAEDDFSLRALHLFLQKGAGQQWENAQSWDYPGGTTLAREGSVLNMEDLGVPAGRTLAYYMQANDGVRHGEHGAGRSRIFHVRVTQGGPAEGAPVDAREALQDVVRRLIKLQRRNLGDTRGLGAWSEETGAETAFDDRAGKLIATEEEIYTTARDAVSAWAGEEETSMVEALGRIAAGPVSDSVERLRDLQAAASPEEVADRAATAAQAEAEALNLLEELLEDPAGTLAKMLEEEGRGEELSEKDEPLTDAEQLAERLLRSLEEFGADQERVIELSNRLVDKPVDDFTDEDKKALQEILDTEKKWTEFFQEAATDLSKLPPQDHSLATQAKEFLEVYSEVQQAIEAAEREAVELAVPHEQAGLELAESIETNLEKWLMETRDDQRWSMEDPLEEYETPMTELPDELQDLIGDLVESEEDMQEQFDDMTSGWMDSLDIGAGWDTMDGPISNMSAKGVTGNRLPNTQEIGGRSGEGRTGKSTGQFVEETATGKGGRQTPSRLTPDPFEAGWVDDTSGEAPSGATGGGKVSGQGAEGFQGPVPPPLHQGLKRLAVQQHQLIDAARRLDYGLKKYRHPRGRLPETIELMKAQENALRGGDVSTFGRYRRVVLSNLREVKELSEKQKRIIRDRSALLPKRLRDEIASVRDEDVPEEYREMVRNYYRALSEAGTTRH